MTKRSRHPHAGESKRRAVSEAATLQALPVAVCINCLRDAMKHPVTIRRDGSTIECDYPVLDTRTKKATVADFGDALAEFVARAAHRFAQNPGMPDNPDADEMGAYRRIMNTLGDLLRGVAPHE